MTSDGTQSRLFLLLGDPVQHSLSPKLQNASFSALGIDAVYAALRCWREMVGPLMRTLAAVGGGGNVTLPHKRAAALALDHATDAVHATGACNVFWWEEGRGLTGDNTDVEAFRVAAEALLGSSLTGRRILLLGAGGAARAVAYACLAAKVEGVDILNRSRSRAESLVGDLGGGGLLRVLDTAECETGYDLVVNATSLGLAPSDPLPLTLDRRLAGAVLDLVYGAAGTRWVRLARELGLKAADGRLMLVEQAAASFRRWFGLDAPRDVMLEAVGLRR